MRISQIICLVVASAGSLGMPAMAQTQTTSAFLAVQKITADPATSKMRVVVKNVGQQKVTGCGLLASSQQYTQEFVYSVGMEPKLTLSRPPGFGGIQPGESVELLFPIEPGRRVDGGGQGSRHAGNRMKRSKTRGRHIT